VEARISVRRLFPSAVLFSLALAGCDGWGGSDNQISGNEAVTVDVPKAAGNLAGITPMAERVAVIGLLNKRNGIVRDLTLKPGQAIRVKDVVVRLRACETTAPWEEEKLTGAFVQLDIRRPDNKWVRRFSGWLYKESPSLNVVEDPTYDVWPKSCAMSWPAGPEAPAAPAASSNRSSSSNEGAGNELDPLGEEAVPTDPSATTEPPTDDSDSANNPT
jgi:hypothetical protein